MWNCYIVIVSGKMAIALLLIKVIKRISNIISIFILIIEKLIKPKIKELGFLTSKIINKLDQCMYTKQLIVERYQMVM